MVARMDKYNISFRFPEWLKKKIFSGNRFVVVWHVVHCSNIQDNFTGTGQSYDCPFVSEANLREASRSDWSLIKIKYCKVQSHVYILRLYYRSACGEGILTYDGNFMISK